MYRLYITLLDSFQRYLDSESDDAKQEFLDRINRVPFFSEAADKGSCFNDLIDTLLDDNDAMAGVAGTEQAFISHTYTRRDGTTATYSFPKNIVKEYVERLSGAIVQVYTEAVLHTSSGDVLLYGYIDDVLPDKVVDIKTTGRYEFPKYLKAWQHRGYSFCLADNGVESLEFEYLVTDFNNIYAERYSVDALKYEVELRAICERLIDFIEANKDQITDTKIFEP